MAIIPLMKNLGGAVDSLSARFALFTLLLIWYYYLAKNVWGAVILAALSSIVVVLIIKKAAEKRKITKYPKDEFYTQLALLGNVYTAGLFAKVQNVETADEKNYFIVGEKLFYAAFRFSPLSKDEVAAAYRTAKNLDGVKKTVIICNCVPREVMTFSTSLPLNFSFMTAPDVYKFFKEKNALPEIVIEKTITKPPKLGARGWVDVIFSETNAKYYLFTGGILAISSFITPMKLYYLVTASLALLFALISKLRQ